MKSRVISTLSIVFSVLFIVYIMNACGDLTKKTVNRNALTSGLDGGISNSVDSDGDGLSDDEEAALGTDPNQADSDGDGLLDGAEVNTHKTDPLVADSDGGGVNDGLEVNLGLDPNLNTDDLRGDADGDGLSSVDEDRIGTDPNKVDSDGDGLSDGAEVNVYTTDPLKADTDGGGVNDGDEVAQGTNPRDNPGDDVPAVNDADKDGLSDADEAIAGTDKDNHDSDNDGLSDGAEVNTIGSNPLDPDTDKGGVYDGVEVDSGTNPLDATDDKKLAFDSDRDGLTDAQEIALGTDPNKADTDDDGLSDGEEVLTHGTSPLNPDTDNGGVYDGVEVGKGLNPLDAGDDKLLDPVAIKFVKTPANPTTDTDAVFNFEVDDAANLKQLQCVLDGQILLGLCENAKDIRLSNLAVGSHSFKVMALSKYGTLSSITYVWEVKAANVDPCKASNVKKLVQTIKFDATNKTCSFGQNGNLSAKDAFIRAQEVQSFGVNVPAGVKVCSVNLSIPQQSFRFDDHMVLSWNQIALATNGDFLLTEAGAEKIYDFEKAKNRPAFQTEKAYCFGADPASTCTVPRHDTANNINVMLSQGAQVKLGALVNTQLAHSLNLSAIGDNDRSDCQHTGLEVQVEVSYGK